MTESAATAGSTATSEWATERGKKWVEHMAPTEVMLAPINEPLLMALSLEGAQRVADIGCGGGRTSRALAERLPARAVVHGIDVSPDVIAAARSAVEAATAAKVAQSAQGASAEPAGAVAGAERGLGAGGADSAQAAESARAPESAMGARLEFQCMDAGAGAPPETLYDRLTSRFGVMFFDDPPAAFANLARWLNPGGRFAFAVWGRLPDNPWMLSLRKAVAEEVEVPAPPPDSPGPFRYADATRFCALLEAAGFSDVAATPWRGDVALGGGIPAAEAAAFCISAFSVGELLGDDAERLARVRERLTAVFQDHEVDGVVRMPAAVHIVTGGR